VPIRTLVRADPSPSAGIAACTVPGMGGAAIAAEATDMASAAAIAVRAPITPSVDSAVVVVVDSAAALVLVTPIVDFAATLVVAITLSVASVAVVPPVVDSAAAALVAARAVGSVAMAVSAAVMAADIADSGRETPRGF